MNSLVAFFMQDALFFRFFFRMAWKKQSVPITFFFARPWTWKIWAHCITAIEGEFNSRVFELSWRARVSTRRLLFFYFSPFWRIEDVKNAYYFCECRSIWRKFEPQIASNEGKSRILFLDIPTPSIFPVVFFFGSLQSIIAITIYV